jgi:hypothetical protein
MGGFLEAGLKRWVFFLVESSAGNLGKGELFLGSLSVLSVIQVIASKHPEGLERGIVNFEDLL